MKRRSLYSATVLFFLATFGISFVQPSTVHAATQQDEASSYCNTITVNSSVANISNDQKNTACEKGFLAALKSGASKPPESAAAAKQCQIKGSTPANDTNVDICIVYLTKQGVCYSQLYPKDSNSAYYCQIGYVIAYYRQSSLANPPPGPTNAPPPTAQETQAAQACQPNIPGASNSGQLLQDCQTGYIGALNNQPQDQACPSSIGASIDQQYCDTGFSLGKQANAAAAAAAAGSDKQLGCTAQFTDPLTWIICPIVDGLGKIVNFIDAMITNQLNVKTSAIFCDTTDTCKAYYAAWQSFRDIALGLMAIAGLVMIIAQALGMEILDAYAIRKTLPRLLIAAVAITLSWPLMRFLIQLSDDLGFGVRHLIYAPFAGLGNSIDLSFGGGIGNLFGAATAVGGAAVAVPVWIIAGGAGALLAYAGTAALAVLVAILILILRQVAIILLMLLAPLALVAYILPNTQRIYRLWWESFSKALLMFPLIAAFIATGRVFSAIAIHNGGIINQLIGFAAYFAPYFMIPLTLRMAGGTMSALGNFVNSRAQGGFGALGEKRKRHRTERVKAAQTGGMYRKDLINKNPFTGKAFKNERSLGKLLNTIGNYSVDIGDSGTRKLGQTKLGSPFFGRRGRILASKIAGQRLEHSQKMLQELDPHYWTGRAMSGRLGYFLDSVKDPAQRSALASQFKNNYGIFDQNNKFTGKYRDINGEKDAWNMSNILSTYGGGTQGAMIAAAELGEGSIVANKIGQMSGPGREETQRADIGTIGLMAAAKAGRLDPSDVVASRNDLIRSGKDFGGFADARMARLQAFGEGKRLEQSRGHMEEYIEVPDGRGGTMMEARSVYDDPTSDTAQKSLMRMDSQHMASGKSELFDIIDDTMLYGGSEYEMEMGPNQRLEYKLDGNGQRVRKTDETALDRASAVRAKIRYMAQYSLGDSDVSRKLKNIARKLDMKESELQWGASVNPEEMRRAQDAGTPPPEEGAQQP